MSARTREITVTINLNRKPKKIKKKLSKSKKERENKVIDDLNAQRLSSKKIKQKGGSVARSPLKSAVDALLAKNMDCRSISKHLKERYGINIGEDALINYKKHFFLQDKKGFQDVTTQQIVMKEFAMVDDKVLDRKVPLNVQETLRIMEMVRGRIFVLQKEVDSLNTVKIVITDEDKLKLEDQKVLNEIGKSMLKAVAGAFKRRLDVEKLINNYIHTMTQLQEYIAKYEVENTEKTVKNNITQVVAEMALTIIMPYLQEAYPEEKVKQFLDEFSKKMKEYLDR